MTQGTDEGGAPAETVADVGTSGDGSGVDEGPLVSLIVRPEESTEYEQLSLMVFLERVETAEQAADAWAVLEYIEQTSQWWKVELVKHVRRGRGGRGVEGGMAEFVRVLKEKHGLELSEQYASELKLTGDWIEELSEKLSTQVESLPVTKAFRVRRARDTERALEIAKSGTQRDLDRYLRAERLDDEDFTSKVYNIWSFPFQDPRYGQEGYKWGLICGQIVENLLHYYTEPGDFVLDPMAGGGTTIDVCNAFERTCMAFDIEPVRDDIFQHDITTGPPLADLCQLVILEPPYYNMKQDAYESLAEYREFLRLAIRHSVERLLPGGYLALIVMDQVSKGQEKTPIIGPAYRLLELAGLKYEHLIGLPLTTEQYTGFDVERAKKAKELLGINRQMWIFRRPGP